MIAAASSKKRTPKTKKEYPQSLIRNVILWILVLSIVPVLITGVVTYLRTRSMLTDQANTQLQAVIDNNIIDLEQFAQTRHVTLDNLLKDKQVKGWIDTLAMKDAKPTDLEVARYSLLTRMQDLLGFNPDPIFNEVFLVNEKGDVLISTNSKRLGRNYNNDNEIKQVMGSSRTSSVYNVPGLFSGDFTWLMSSTYQSPTTIYQYTLIGAIDSPLVKNILVQGGKYLNSGHMFLFTNNLVLGVGTTGDLLGHQNTGEQIDALRGIIRTERQRGTLNYISYGKVPVLSYAHWNPELQMGLALEVSEDIVYDQLTYLGRFYLLILIGCLLIAAVSLVFGTRTLVRPILALVTHVRSFAEGDFSSRAPENRKDELGLLAHSFNIMADQLGQMYRSLETKVEERSRQLLTAGEVAQVTTSASTREEILKQTVALVTDRFEYDYACIYLLDPSGSSFTLREAGGQLSEGQSGVALDQRIRTQSNFGLAIAQNQPAVVDEPDEEGADWPETLLRKARSEAIVPISAGNQVLGILDVQSRLADVFNPETVDVLKMLATQVANGLQNIQLLESTKIDLQETNLLYRASRQITRATEPGQIGQIINETIAQSAYIGLVLTINEDQLRATSLIDKNSPNRKLPVLIMTLEKVAHALSQNTFLLFDHLNQPGDFFPILNFYSQTGCSQVAVLPVRLRGQISQVICLGSREKGILTEASLQPYLSLVEVIANTEERFRVLHSLEENLTEMKTVSTISEALSVETDLQVLFELLYEQVVKNIGQLDFYVALVDEAAQLIRMPFVVWKGVPTQVAPFRLGDGMASILVKRGEPLLLSRNAVQQAAAMGVKLVGSPARSWMGVPLVLGGKVVGVMVAEDTETDGRFTERELHLFTTLAPQVTVAIRNAQLLTEMQQAINAYDQERFLLNTLLDKIPDQIYFKDTDGRYIRGSQSLLSELGLQSQEELIGKTESEVASGETALAISADEQTVMATGQAHEGIIEKYHHEDGSDEWALVSRLPMVNDSGATTGLLAISRDITGLKQAEELAQKRAQQLRTAAEIARDTSGTRNVDELLVKAVNLVRDRFGFYHSSIFLLDALGEYMVLRESTGEAGRRLKEAGHRLAVGSQSIVGQSVSRGEALVVNNVTQDPNYYPNPLLPDTHSETALPLKVGDRVLGAIDVQSTSVNAFLSEDINILQTLADQLAIAIVNADLFVQTQENLAKHRFLHQITTAAASANSLDEALESTVNGLITALGNERVTIYLTAPDGSLKIRAYSGYKDANLQGSISVGEGVIGLAAMGRHPILIRDTQNDSRCTGIDEQVRSLIAVPILYSDRTVGVLSIESSHVAAFDENDQEILGSLGNNLGAILANTQLVSQVRQQVEQQKNLFDITSKIRRSTDMETVMQTSVRELCRAVHAQRARIQITIGGAAQPAEPSMAGSQAAGSNGHNGHNGNGSSGRNQEAA